MAIPAIRNGLAMGALCAMKEACLRHLEQGALVGFDEISIPRLVRTTLSTAAAPERCMGVEITRVQRLIAGYDPADQRMVFPVSLVIRGSCGSHKLLSRCEDQAGRGQGVTPAAFG